jgi:transcriptional regulator with XRE-family HTH domain
MTHLARLLEPVRTGFLVKKLKRSRTAVASWKRGESLPDPELLTDLAHLLNLEPEIVAAAYAKDAAAR